MPIFQSDFATAHYAKTCLEWHKWYNIVKVTKSINPQYVPELRPIERYWAINIWILRQSQKVAKIVQDMKIYWLNGTKQQSIDSIKSLMQGIQERVKKWGKQK